LGVRTIDDVIWDKCAPNPLKVSVNRQFQAKMQNIEIDRTLRNYKSDQAEI